MSFTRHPFAAIVTERNLTRWPDCVVLAKIHFYPIDDDPFAFGQTVRPVSCGEILDEGGSTPIPLHLCNEKVDPERARRLPTTVQEAYEHFSHPGEAPRISLTSREACGHLPFSLVYSSPFSARIYFLQQPLLAPGSGKMPSELDLARLG